MKRLAAWLMSGVVLAGLLVTLLLPTPAFAADRRNIADDKISERAGKIDLNNCSVRRFQQFPGMYPTLAGKIVLGGPYSSVDDVLNLEIARLTEDGWLEDSFEHSYLFRYREYAIQGVLTDEIEGIKITRLPTTPEA